MTPTSCEFRVFDLERGESWVFDVAPDAYGARVGHQAVSFNVYEGDELEDLNGDGDWDDSVAHLWVRETGEMRNLRLAASSGGRGRAYAPALVDDWCIFGVPESAQGDDVNQDGDRDDYVTVIHEFSTGKNYIAPQAGEPVLRHRRQLMLRSGHGVAIWDVDSGAVEELPLPLRWVYSPVGASSFVLLSGDERVIGQDLDGDGKAETQRVLFVYRFQDGTLRNTRLSMWLDHVLGENVLGSVPDEETGERQLLAYDVVTDEIVEVGVSGRKWDRRLANTWVTYWAFREGLHAYDVATGAKVKLGRTVLGSHGEWALLRGDAGDYVVHLGSGLRKDLPARVVTGFDPRNERHNFFALEAGLLRRHSSTPLPEFASLLLERPEAVSGLDVNGDGDLEDRSLLVHDPETGETEELGLVMESGAGFGPLRFDGGLWFAQREAMGGGGGDAEVAVVRLDESERSIAQVAWISNIKPRIMGEEELLYSMDHAYDQHYLIYRTYKTPISSREEWFILGPGHPQVRERSPFLRGDCNDDGGVDISDAVFTLESQFLGLSDPTCDDACDSNDDGVVDVSDALTTLGVLFLGNGVIPPPGMTDCGVDPTEDELGCETAPAGCQ